ncbi:MAG: hypothetical protein ACKPA7_30430 [Sphaerospermopsis kisseleviana]
MVLGNIIPNHQSPITSHQSPVTSPQSPVPSPLLLTSEFIQELPSIC